MKQPLLQRVGVRYLVARSSRVRRVVPFDAVHFLNAFERTAMRRVQAGAMLRAALAGAISGGRSRRQARSSRGGCCPRRRHS